MQVDILPPQGPPQGEMGRLKMLLENIYRYRSPGLVVGVTTRSQGEVRERGFSPKVDYTVTYSETDCQKCGGFQGCLIVSETQQRPLRSWKFCSVDATVAFFNDGAGQILPREKVVAADYLASE